MAWAADVKSGLAVGEFVGAFDVKDCSGPSEGKTLCYRCQYGNRPVVAVFTRRLTDDLDVAALLEHDPNTFPDDQVIVDEEHTDLLTVIAHGQHNG